MTDSGIVMSEHSIIVVGSKGVVSYIVLLTN